MRNIFHWALARYRNLIRGNAKQVTFGM